MADEVISLGLIPIDMIKVTNRFREDKGEIEALAENIKERGLIHPVTVDQNMNLLAGERRLLAHQMLGRDTIRAEQRHTKDKLEIERDENVFRKPFTWVELANIEKAIWDMNEKRDPKWSLRKQEELRDTNRTTLMMRIKLAEALPLLPELAECETQDEAWKQYKKLEEEAGIEMMRRNVPDEVKQAPKWAADHYRVGDALAGLAKERKSSVDFAEVDPPYAIDLHDRKERNKSDEIGEEYNEVSIDDFPAFFTTIATEVFRILKQNTFAAFWYGHQWHSEVYKILTTVGFQVNATPAIWYKGQAGQTAQPDIMLGSSYESFFLARKGQPRMKRQGRSNVFHYAPVAPSRKIHMTEKPIELLTDILDTMLLPGSKVLVPFLGSGVTLRAAYKLGHTGFGWDMSDKHKARFLRKVADEFAEESMEPVDE